MGLLFSGLQSHFLTIAKVVAVLACAARRLIIAVVRRLLQIADMNTP